MGPEDKVDISKLPENIMSSIPGLDSGIFKDKNKPQKKVCLKNMNLFVHYNILCYIFQPCCFIGAIRQANSEEFSGTVE